MFSTKTSAKARNRLILQLPAGVWFVIPALAQDGVRAAGDDFRPLSGESASPFMGMAVDAGNPEDPVTVHEFADGVVIQARGSSLPGINSSRVSSLDNEVLETLLEATNISRFDTNSLQIELALDNRLELEDSRIPETALQRHIITFVQKVNGYRAGEGTITLEVGEEISTVQSADGVLVDPNLPQLQPENWIRMETARNLAIEALMPLALDVPDGWFMKAVEKGSVTGTIELLVAADYQGISAKAVYKVSGDADVALVNMYTGETDVRQILGPKPR